MRRHEESLGFGALWFSPESIRGIFDTLTWSTSTRVHRAQHMERLLETLLLGFSIEQGRCFDGLTVQL